jgi:hypothetical protein
MMQYQVQKEREFSDVNCPEQENVTVVPIIRLIKGMEQKLSMVYQLNLICMVGDPN